MMNIRKARLQKLKSKAGKSLLANSVAGSSDKTMRMMEMEGHIGMEMTRLISPTTDCQMRKAPSQ